MAARNKRLAEGMEAGSGDEMQGIRQGLKASGSGLSEQDKNGDNFSGIMQVLCEIEDWVN